MGIAKLYGQKASGTNINGIIKDYHAYAGENISAGDLVEYINGIAGKVDYGTSSDTVIDTVTNAGYVISAVLLDESRVFIAFSPGTTCYLCGMVVTIDGTTITQGAKTQLTSSNYTGYTISAVLVGKDKIFVAHSSDTKTSSSNYLFGVVCTISGVTITAGSSVKLSSGNYTGYTISTELLPSGKIFVVHTYGSNYNLYGIICTISGTTISGGSDTALSTEERTGTTISTELLSNGNVFIAHSYSSNYHLYGIVCAISGTTITTGTDTVLNNSEKYTGYKISATLLSNGNVFIAHVCTSSYSLYGMVVTISGTAITAGTDTQLNSSEHHPTITTISLKNNKVFVMYNQGNTTDAYYLNGLIANISGTEITVGSDTILNSNRLTGYMISPCLLTNGTIFVAHSYGGNYYLYAQIFGIDEVNNIPTNQIVADEYETQVRKTTTSKFVGVAKEIVPTYDTVTKLIKADIIPKTWTEVTAGTEYVAEDGTKLTASSAGVLSCVNVCDGDVYTNWQQADDSPGARWVKLEFPEPIEITKMQIQIGIGETTPVVQGSYDGIVWEELYVCKTDISISSPISLTHTMKAKFYRIYATTTNYTNTPVISEWKVYEYGVQEQVQGKDLVSIYTLDTNFVTADGNAIMTADKNTFITKQ